MNRATWQATSRNALFEEIPCGIVVMDPELRIVDQNRTFTGMFGFGRGRSCYELWRKSRLPCPDCPAEKTFEDGKQRVVEETGTDIKGRALHYLVQYSPILDEQGQVSHVAAITTDLTATKRLRQEYQTLFEKVPCYVAVLNRDRRVIMANRMFRRTFGEPRGEHCYKLLKQRSQVCEDCPAERTFADGGVYTSRHAGTAQDGTPTDYVVSTAPLHRGEGEVTHVIEMALDVTENRQLQFELQRANLLRKALVENSLDAIVVLDDTQRVVLMNRAAEELWGFPRERALGRKVPRKMVPGPVKKLLAGHESSLLLHDSLITPASGDDIPVRLAAVTLEDQSKPVGAAVFAHDLRPIKQLEHDKLEAERLAAVGQTVAGLAHGIKNILTGLEGGMYVTSTGLRKGDQSRVERGWGMLERNMGRISSLARDLLAFSRGDTPRPHLTDPARLVREVVDLYRELAEQHGITLLTDIQPDIAPASLDGEGIHSCLTNLISNAVDACLVSQRDSFTITVSLREQNDCLEFEVTDTGCGMDYEIKQKVFTSFFTTKGGGGSGLGLLTTRKIVQQHGGEIEFTSTPGQGTNFCLRFCRARLPKPLPEEDATP